jgi:cell division septation protein DedD
MSNERSRDFGGAPSHGSDNAGADRRDAGAEALLELARLIGGQNDPFAPEASKADPRLSDVSRSAASQADAGRDPFVRPQGASGRREPGFGADAARGSTGAEPSGRARAGGFDFPEPDGHDDFPPPPPRQDATGYDLGAAAYRRRRDESSDAYAADGGEYDEPDDYDEEETTPRRSPTKVIMALLGLAVLGSAAAYGYRTFVNVSPSGPPPIIKADNSPSKITPMTDVRADSGRTGDRIGGEQMLRRDEDPVDVGTGAGGDASGVVTAAVVPAATPGDPRRVHTVPIQGAVSSSDRPAPRGASPQAAAQAPAAQAPAAAAPQPRQLAAAAQPRQVAVATASPPPDTSAAALVDSGGYVVQLSAVRSEADAQTAFRQMQTKYPVLSGRQPLIRRKDQGDRGIFFAAQVGPFGAKSEADQLCVELKAAGGSCFVQRN